MSRLEGRNALVTGGSRGIGRAISLRLAEMGANVAVNYANSQSAAEEVVSEIADLGVITKAYKADVSDRESCETMVAEAVSDFGQIDILCAVAGIFREAAPIQDQLDSDWDDVVETNLTGVMRCLRSSWPLFANGASIVTVGSVLAEMAQPEVGAYAVSKAGLSALTRTSASEGVARGIRANLIVPGMVNTPMNQRMADASGNSEEWWHDRLSSIPMKRAAEPEEIAEAICWLSSDDARFVTGAEIRLDGGALLGPLPSSYEKT